MNTGSNLRSPGRHCNLPGPWQTGAAPSLSIEAE